MKMPFTDAERDQIIRATTRHYRQWPSIRKAELRARHRDAIIGMSLVVATVVCLVIVLLWGN